MITKIQPKSVAEKSGLAENDVIGFINGSKIKSVKDLETSLNGISEALLHIRRGEEEFFAHLRQQTDPDRKAEKEMKTNY